MDRRKFLLAGAGGALGSMVSLNSGCKDKHVSKGKIHRHDIIIAGGGPAGCSAALAAAKLGADVAMIEQYPFFGGVWTMGTLSVIIDHQNKTGLMKYIETKLRKEGHAGNFRKDWNKFVYNVEAMKLLLDDMLGDSGAKLRLHTFVAGVEKKGKSIESLVTVSKSGFENWEGKVFLDCTGDGDVGALAGCEFHKGREADGSMQPGTMYGLVGGLKDVKAMNKEMRKIFEEAGIQVPYEGILLFRQDGMPGMAYLMPSHIYGLDGTDADSLTEAEFEGRRQVRFVVDVLKKHGGEYFKDIYLAATAPCVGIREGRRIVGKYYLTIDDMKEGRKFNDGICDVQMVIDIHHPKKKEGMGLYNVKVQPYQIPLRSLQARDCNNLLTAGRCISGSFDAHASYRVTGDSVPIGEAAGVAAVMAVEKGIPPAELNGEEVRKMVEKQRKEWG
ncbi:FAD-dependent oxidoreductase [candidate division KSB1 bacterium]